MRKQDQLHHFGNVKGLAVGRCLLRLASTHLYFRCVVELVRVNPTKHPRCLLDQSTLPNIHLGQQLLVIVFPRSPEEDGRQNKGMKRHLEQFIPKDIVTRRSDFITGFHRRIEIP